MRGIDWVQRAHHAALHGRQLDRRQGRDQPPEGQEPDRRLPPAEGGGDRPRLPRHAARRARCRSGAYEILKCGILADRALFASLAERPAGLRGLEPRGRSRTRSRRPAASRPRWWRRTSARGGLRRVLNLGHTLGHALETVTRYRRFTHGEAVGWGLIGAAWIARRRGPARRDGASTRSPRRWTTSARGRASRTSPTAALLEAVARDKKARAGGRSSSCPPRSAGCGQGRRGARRDQARPEGDGRARGAGRPKRRLS